MALTTPPAIVQPAASPVIPNIDYVLVLKHGFTDIVCGLAVHMQVKFGTSEKVSVQDCRLPSSNETLMHGKRHHITLKRIK